MTLQLKNIYKSYNQKIVFTNLNLDFSKNTIYAALGNASSGKSTLLHIMAGLVLPDFGSIVSTKKPSMVFQEPRLIENISTLQNLTIVLPKSSHNTNKAKLLLSMSDMQDSTHNPAAHLSKCKQKRLAICRSLMIEFDVLLLDEPFFNITDSVKQKMVDIILSYCKDKTIVVVSKNKETANLLQAHTIYNLKSTNYN